MITQETKGIKRCEYFTHWKIEASSYNLEGSMCHNFSGMKPPRLKYDLQLENHSLYVIYSKLQKPTPIHLSRGFLRNWPGLNAPNRGVHGFYEGPRSKPDPILYGVWGVGWAGQDRGLRGGVGDQLIPGSGGPGAVTLEAYQKQDNPDQMCIKAIWRAPINIEGRGLLLLLPLLILLPVHPLTRPASPNLTFLSTIPRILGPHHTSYKYPLASDEFCVILCLYSNSEHSSHLYNKALLQCSLITL